jgi:hypothetical protein
MQAPKWTPQSETPSFFPAQTMYRPYYPEDPGIFYPGQPMYSIHEIVPQYGMEQEEQEEDKFKTEMCRKFASTGVCRYGDQCQL